MTTVVKMAFKSVCTTIETVEGSSGLTLHGVHGSNNVVGKRKFDWLLDDGAMRDGDMVPDQPYRHASIEELVAGLGVSGKTPHPICANGPWGCGGIGNVREDFLHVIEECNNVEKVSLSLSDKQGQVTERDGMIQQDHDVVVERLKHFVDDVLLVSVSLSPFGISSCGDLA